LLLYSTCLASHSMAFRRSLKRKVRFLPGPPKSFFLAFFLAFFLLMFYIHVLIFVLLGCSIHGPLE
jgi:hypothetical protein